MLGNNEDTPAVQLHNNRDKSVSFDVDAPSLRHDPKQPKPALEQPNLVVRRSTRNLNKPSRFRAMFTQTAAAMILTPIPISIQLMSTHPTFAINAFVPGGIHAIAGGSHDVHNKFWYEDLPPSTNPVSNAHHEYVRLCDSEYDRIHDTVDGREWTPLQLLDHRVRKRRGQRTILAKVSWLTDTPTWIPLSALRMQEPFLVVDYILRIPQLLRSPDFHWTKEYVRDISKMEQLAHVFQAKTSRTPKFKFGVEVPSSIAHALQLDKRAGNNLWGDAIGTELQQLNDYRTFRHRRPNEDLSDYTRIPYHCVFDVKFNGRRKCRLVAGGNMTTPSKESVFSGVVDISSVHLGFLLDALNDLQICATDIGNAFLYGRTREKVYIRAGKEFGEHTFGKILIIDKSLYGLRTSSARFHEHLSTKLRSMGYQPSKAYPHQGAKIRETYIIR
jgi:hypothetical protein